MATAAADVFLYALLGTGSRSEPSHELALVVDALNASGNPVLAVDIPTGVDATTGAAAASTVRARATVTLGAPKLGLVLQPARSFAGAIYLGEIGMEPSEVDVVSGERYAALDDAETTVG